ncbi:MAG: peptidoglycan DD-metalloendopeptidase family protein [Pseudomonadota bacterium]
MIGHVYTLALRLTLLLGASAIAFSYAHAATQATGAKEELRELKSRIDAIQKRLNAAEESKTETADALRKSERAISEATRQLADLSEQSSSANAKLVGLQHEITQGEAELAKHRARLGKLVYQHYAAGRPEALGVLLNGGDPNAVARRLHYLTYIARARSEQIALARAGLENLTQLAGEARNQAQELAAIAAEQAARSRSLESEKRTRAQMLTRISQQIERQRQEIGTLKRDETRLTRLIDQLARALAQMPKPRREPQARTTPEPRLRNERLPEPATSEGPFAQLRGRLALPVRGELAGRFGSPRQDGGVVWKGLFIAARTGEEVRAVAPGRVVYADWLRGFGNLLIIDHGGSYMSLYGYNETLFKQVGDAIRGGERISAVGNTGGQPDSGLYFEMRHEGRPFDPMTWVSAR